MELWGEIGAAAGKVYSSIVGSAGPATVLEVKRKTKLDDAMLYMALGWLAREGRAQIDSERNVLKVKINE
ncbi:MAG: winged helix-turn-helix domain-containing protein [Candidatus Altiarchaeota archaeon]|nr:winged helix-turn-helix domain-containing protein [Candidatus Altiarchaeota archaeon]